MLSEVRKKWGESELEQKYSILYPQNLDSGGPPSPRIHTW